ELLRDELKDIRKKRILIERNALKLYNSVMENPETGLAKRTVDFKTLMAEYNKY
ncbi:MAG: type III toxin-antitoxin system ToxN/AbiQ family toxin, partial [Nanoarchaeota archaeon]